MYVSSGIEIPFAFELGHAGLGSSCSTYTGSSSAGNASRHDSRVRYQQNNAFSGLILPNYAASLKYAFSAENSAGFTRQTLMYIHQKNRFPELSWQIESKITKSNYMIRYPASTVK